MKIYAGLDTDGIAKLFTVINNEPAKIEHSDWLKILDQLGAEPGEMLVVELSRESEDKH